MLLHDSIIFRRIQESLEEDSWVTEKCIVLIASTFTGRQVMKLRPPTVQPSKVYTGLGFFLLHF